ncbi:hypothetical protein [Flagellimonas meishanensis]|uniref:hypothetical protein n=1 Tax=Flagellimonas meishanensis TaxID=2873264 RepID=UPI001CA675B7|nr:hypothetical protein [[Muricauda] meishanensis]
MLDIIRLLLIFFLFSAAQFGHGQNFGASSSGKETLPIYIEGFNYPSFEKYHHYGWFRVNFGVTPTTEVSIGGEHYRNYMADRFAIPIELRQYVSKNTFLIGGYEREWDLLNNGKGKPNPIPREEIYFGVGQDVGPNMLMEAKFAQPLGNPRFYKVGLEGVKTRLQVGTKLKF